METCKICKNSYSSLNGLSKHIVASHSEKISKEDYFNKFIYNPEEYYSKKCLCGAFKKFRGLGEGYREYCSPQCAGLHVVPSKYWLGKKQPKEMIKLRVANTNQILKQKTVETNNLNNYGVKNIAELSSTREKMSKSQRGLIKPRSLEHQESIIQSKMANGTLNHSEATKSKISISVRKTYSSDNPPITLSKNTKGYNTGVYKGLVYRSSYELAFIKTCEKLNIDIRSAENSDFRVKYKDCQGVDRWYYPDFYLPDLDLVVEVKPSSMLDYGNNLNKFDAASRKHSFTVLTEEDIFFKSCLKVALGI